jgi:type VI secretion system protein ImpG
MDPRLLEYYNRELQFLREMGAEFATQYPRIAARLGLDGMECADPYVERLLEGVAFLTARVQLKLDARHPEFTQHLLEMVYPHFLAPVPSCAIAEFTPDFKEDSLQAGVKIPRGASLSMQLHKGERTACEFRTAHDVVLWPLTVAEARYISGTGSLAALGVPVDERTRAAIRLRLRSTGGIPINSLPLDELTFFIKASTDTAARIHEQVLADGISVFARGTSAGAVGHRSGADAIVPVGYSDSESLLPATSRTFEGYRLLQEYFAFPERFLFFKVRHLANAVRACSGTELDVYVVLDRAQPALENALDAQQFRLYCSPIINLFHKSLDRIHVGDYDTEHHVLPDRNRPMDFEVHSIRKVTGIGAEDVPNVAVLPFYSSTHYKRTGEEKVYFTMQRRQRLFSSRQQQTGTRTSYIGTEVFISVVDGREQSLANGFRQLDVEALCTNRDLPIHTTFGKGRTDFLLEGSAPIESIRCITGPTYPKPSPAFGDTAWKLISQLSLNHLSLRDGDAEGGAELLRELLSLYADANDPVQTRQIEGVRHIAYTPVVERIPGGGPITYGRGLKIALTLDDAAFEGTGILILASVLEQFFARYVSLNSFTRMELRSQGRGEIKQWTPRLGVRATL